MNTLVYDRGKRRFKHCWKHDEAGFVPENRRGVGKCHRSITLEIAQALLRGGIPRPDVYAAPHLGIETKREGLPDQVWNLYRGVPYIAVHTERNKASFHGYPWGWRKIPVKVRKQLEVRADAAEERRTFDDWRERYRC